MSAYTGGFPPSRSHAVSSGYAVSRARACVPTYVNLISYSGKRVLSIFPRSRSLRDLAIPRLGRFEHRPTSAVASFASATSAVSSILLPRSPCVHVLSSFLPPTPFRIVENPNRDPPTQLETRAGRYPRLHVCPYFLSRAAASRGRPNTPLLMPFGEKFDGLFLRCFTVCLESYKMTVALFSSSPPLSTRE